MAVYKVIQNVESEDKLVGPLTLRQFIYGCLAAALIFVNFKLFITTGLGVGRWLAIAFFSAPMVLFAVLAAPLGGDQPTELWLLSHLQFMFRPRKRTWDQNGQVQSVRITAPKRGPALSKNLTQGEVKSRLKALSEMLDSRGWAVQSTPQFQSVEAQVENNDRLVGADTLEKTAPDVDVRPRDDVLDEAVNATAQRYGALVREAEEKKKSDLAQKIKNAVAKNEAKAKESEIVPSKPRWGVQNINPIAIIKPDESRLQRVAEVAAAQPNLEARLKAAGEALQAEHPGASSLSEERERRRERKLLSENQMTKSNLVNSDNFSVATIAAMANRDGGDQLVRSMPI